MSAATILFQLQNAVMKPGTPAAPTITAIESNGHAMRAYGNGVPTVVQGYAHGCEYTNIAGVAAGDTVFRNLGTALAANWTVLTVN